MEWPKANRLDQAQTLTQNISGLVGDAFGIIDASMKSISSTKNIGDTLVRALVIQKIFTISLKTFNRISNLVDRSLKQ